MREYLFLVIKNFFFIFLKGGKKKHKYKYFLNILWGIKKKRFRSTHTHTNKLDLREKGEGKKKKKQNKTHYTSCSLYKTIYIYIRPRKKVI